MAEIEYIEAATPANPADQVVDLDHATPSGAPCQACGSPVEPLDKFCPACGCPNESAPQLEETDSPADDKKFMRCDQCGAEVGTDLDQRSYTCLFCDSTYVVEYSREETGRQAPEFVIGFAVTPEQAQAKFHHWIGENAWFRPGDLKTASVADKQKGVYLPFWSFSMLAQSRWSASIGEHWYRTETYTTTDSKGNVTTHTRQVQETEWWPLSGNHHDFYNGYLVSGSRGLSQKDADRIQPFQLPALRRYEPYYLAGWLNEEYSIDRDMALATCKQEFYRREQHNITAFLPGDTHRNLAVDTTFSNESSDLCLLPVYVLSYRYREKLYRFLVNGQTGKVAGEKPWSGKRIMAFILILLLLIFIIVIGGAFLFQ